MAKTIKTATTWEPPPAQAARASVFAYQLSTTLRMVACPIQYLAPVNRWKWQGTVWKDRGTAGWRRLCTCTFFVEDNTDDAANWTVINREEWTYTNGSGTWANYNAWGTDDTETAEANSNSHYVKYNAASDCSAYVEFTVPSGYRYATLDYSLPFGSRSGPVYACAKFDLRRDPSGDNEAVALNGIGIENYEEKEALAGFNEPDQRNGCIPWDSNGEFVTSDIVEQNLENANVELYANLTPGETYRLTITKPSRAAGTDWTTVTRLRIRDWPDETSSLPDLSASDKSHYGLEFNAADEVNMRHSTSESAYVFSWNGGSFMGGSHGNETVVTDTWAADTTGDGTYDGAPTWTTGVWDGPYYKIRLTHDADLNDGSKRADLLFVEEVGEEFQYGRKNTLTVTWTGSGDVSASYIAMLKSLGTESGEPVDWDGSSYPFRISDVSWFPDDETLADPHTLGVDNTGNTGTTRVWYNNDITGADQDLEFVQYIDSASGGNWLTGTNGMWFDSSNDGKSYVQIAGSSNVTVSATDEWSFVWYEGYIYAPNGGTGGATKISAGSMGLTLGIQL